jgi:hypothetical protein
MKPHIRLAQDYDAIYGEGETWFCDSDVNVGHGLGRTPVEAYSSWNAGGVYVFGPFVIVPPVAA